MNNTKTTAENFLKGLEEIQSYNSKLLDSSPMLLAATKEDCARLGEAKVVSNIEEGTATLDGTIVKTLVFHGVDNKSADFMPLGEIKKELAKFPNHYVLAEHIEDGEHIHHTTMPVPVDLHPLAKDFGGVFPRRKVLYATYFLHLC